MRLRQGPDDGTQPRDHVLAVLERKGVHVADDGGGFYELTDYDDDSVVMFIPDPVPPELIVALFRRFGEMHDFLISELVGQRPH